MMLSRKRWLAVLIAFVVAADWASKFMIHNQMPLRARRDVVAGLLSFQHNFNEGIAFSWFRGLPDAWRTPLLVVLTLVGIGATAMVMRQSRDRWVHVAGALVLGGALGNFGDRLLNGGVTDFIYVHFFPYIFNVADIFISIGGVLLVARMLLDSRGRDESTPTPA